MKTYCRNKVIGYEDVGNAFAAWLCSKGGKTHSARLIAKYGNKDAIVDEIYNEIVNRNLKFEPINHIKRFEQTANNGQGKWRTLGIQSSKQQICDYLIVELLMPMFNAHFDYYQCAAIKGRGQKFANKAVEKFTKKYKYAVKQDVFHYFESVNQESLMNKLKHYVGSNDVLYVIETCLKNYNSGLDIGSHLSQYLANWIMSFVCRNTHELKSKRRGTERKLVGSQVWHMDDCLIFGNSKSKVRKAAQAAERYCLEEFGLKIKPWKIVNLEKEQARMCGYAHQRHRPIRILSGTFKRAKRAFNRMSRKPGLIRARRCISYWGRFKLARLFKMMRRYGKIFYNSRKVVSEWSKHENAVRL